MKEFKFNIDTILYFVLLLGFFDTVTRFNFMHELSPFRVAIIVVMFYVIIENLNILKKYILFMVGIAIYSLLMIVLYNGNINLFISHYIHWMFIFMIFALIMHLRKNQNFEKEFFDFLDIMTMMVIVVFYFEYFFGIRLFAGAIAEYSLPSTFFYGINDHASAIMIMGVLYAVKFIYEKNILSFFKFSLIFFSVTIVGARVSMLVLTVAIALAFVLRVCEKIEAIFYRRLLYIIAIGILGLVTIIYLNPNVGDASVVELIIEPINQIMRLEVLSFQGSVTVRTSALILGLKSLISTLGFGIGLGNSTDMLTNYGFQVLKSMHNMFMQLWVELGWIFLFVYFMILLKIIKIYRIRKRNMDACALLLIILFPLFGLQSSEGLLSIYPFWMTLFYVILLVFKNNDEVNRGGIR